MGEDNRELEGGKETIQITWNLGGRVGVESSHVCYPLGCPTDVQCTSRGDVLLRLVFAGGVPWVLTSVGQ